MGGDQVRTVEVVATLSLATDLATGVPLEHGLHSALIARRLGDCLSTDVTTAEEAFYISLLFSIGCTGTALTAARVFGDDDALTTYAAPVRFEARAAGQPAQHAPRSTTIAPGKSPSRWRCSMGRVSMRIAGGHFLGEALGPHPVQPAACVRQ
jgi:hypothetical protein